MERERKKAGMRGIGNPAHLIENFKALEDAGVDQLILLHQCGNYRHEDICASLELFAKEVQPQFKEREEMRMRKKQEALALFVEKARAAIIRPEPMAHIPPVEAYPLLWEQARADAPQGSPDRRPGMTAFWQMQVGGNRKKASND
jgi:hypothetical protein